MKFEPMSDEQIAKLNLIPEGQYQFEVVDAEDKVSARGNEMIAVKLKIWDRDGKERTLMDWLMPSFPKKLKHFCENTGLQDKYNLGNVIAEDCRHKSGCLSIMITKNQKGEDWNTVNDYLSFEKKNLEMKKETREDPFFNDDLPF